MFKQLTTALAIIASSLTFSQVGIGTETPHASADLELASPDKSLYLNRVEDPETDIADPQPGMILYDTTLHCLRAYQGEPAGWSDCLNGGGNSGSGTITAFNCGAATFAPSTATKGVNYNGHLEISYTGGNGGTYEAQSFTSNGLTFTLAAGNFAIGDGLVRYSISGTPTNAGTTYVEISLGGRSCGGANAMALSVNDSTPNNPQGPSSGATGGRFTGKSCFDVAQTNEGGQCGSLAGRQAQRADFTQTSTNTQFYTFTPTGTVSNVRFTFVNTNGTVITSLTGGNSGNNITGAVTATVKFNTSLNSLAAGKNPNEGLTADIYVTYNASADNTGTDFQFRITVNVRDCVCCGAFIAPGVWKQFMCHNLGANTSLDPHTPVAAIHGNKYYWGIYNPAVSQAGDAGSGSIAGWTTIASHFGTWTDDFKTGTDPCAVGFRVPTIAQWEGVKDNNFITYTGNFTSSATNFGSAVQLGTTTGSPTLTLPTVGRRHSASQPGFGTLHARGFNGWYWSTTPHEDYSSSNKVAQAFLISPTGVGLTSGWMNEGYAVRCIEE